MLGNKQQVMWNTSHNRADGYNEKALVVARILRERNRTAIRRSGGAE
jgi:hypothetical protein